MGKMFHSDDLNSKCKKSEKKERLDRQNDFSEKLKISNEIEDPVIEGRNISSTSKSILEDQLKEVHLDIDMLIHRKHELETFVEEKVQEADTLTSQIEELAPQLEKEKEECKRSQARLQKSGEHLGLNISGTSGDEENSNINIVSDDETNGLRTSYTQKALRGNTSPSKKRQWSNKDIPEGPIPDGKGCQAETIRSGKRSRWSERPSQSNIDKEMLKDSRASISLPSTSMVARADDDDVLKLKRRSKHHACSFYFFHLLRSSEIVTHSTRVMIRTWMSTEWMKKWYMWILFEFMS
ncbi:Zinc finger C-x8-C-x5-C-x3-H type family protein [Hibiscus syriacus]|uniref:Zinc finger C-x8-C-x5-C-x3-H type family protein n=1 Tax=Hibiscus syriacus TaxID=106335 RepID=A0A6A2X8S4_HIBSY|nr:Zinc finger C-x8-C-x5-C-x3-H type family protein [Hibiscus syriacus]